MCGYAGFIEFNPDHRSSSERVQILQSMGRSLALRGPDDCQFFDDTLSLVFRRLSIIDIENGKQPIWNEDRTKFIAVNGEIYNYKELRTYLKKDHEFKTNSDAEVVLHLFEEIGIKVLDLLIGMYSIIIWDTKVERLFLARDRLGIKPLFYHITPTLLLFGSELKALLCHPDCPRELRWRDIDAVFLNVIAKPGLTSFLDGVEQLPGGSYAIYENKQIYIHKYWQIDDYFSDSVDKSSKGFVENYATLLEDSVKNCLISDVPLGVFLSGGLDSSVVVAIAAKYQKEIHCFHALEKTVVRCGDTSAALSLTSFLGVPLHKVIFDHQRLVEELQFDLSAFEYFIWLFDSPCFHMEWLLKHELHRYAKTINPQMKVMLIGQGADEFAGGYSQIYGEGHTNSSWENYESDIQKSLNQRAANDKQVSSVFQNLMTNSFFETLSENKNSIFHAEMQNRIVLLQNYNLWHEDRSSAGLGMESRVPFLDHRLIELLASMPNSMQSELFWKKNILRKAAERWVPKEYIDRPKVGFFFVNDISSISDLAQRMLKSIFNDFNDKYLNRPNAIFSSEKMQQLYIDCLQGGRMGRTNIERMFGCMAIEVFYSLCRINSDTTVPENSITTTSSSIPSPLHEDDNSIYNRWLELKDELIPNVSNEDIIKLEGDITLARSISGIPIIYFIRDGYQTQDIILETGMEWVEVLVHKLKTAPCTLAELTESIGVSVKDIRQVLQYLIGLGFVNRS